MYKKIVLMFRGCLCFFTLAACWPKIVDDADVVTVDYVLSFENGENVAEWTEIFLIWEQKDNWKEAIVLWAKQDDEFVWKINWSELYQYNSSLVQDYPNIIIKEVMGIENPTIGVEVFVNSYWTWVITNIDKDTEWYDVYVVDFNDPKTYSELSYFIKVIDIEKN